MALRKRGKQGFYSCYFRAVVARPDGSLKYAMRTIALGTADLIEARALEAEIMRKNQAARLHQRFLAKMTELEVAAGEKSAEDIPVITRDTRKRRLRLSNVLEAAEKYRSVGATAAKQFRAFAREMSVWYVDEVTPEIAFAYLDDNFANAKTFNNNKGSLNAIFKSVLIEAGLDESPFERIPNRKVNAQHQRPFSEAEFRKIYHAAEEPWKTAVLIAWFTGLRKKDVFMLKWAQLDGDVITTTPAKTARYGRSVQIPLHPQLQKHLQSIPRVGEFILGDHYRVNDDYFPRLLEKLNIHANARGIVNFNSIRDSFVTRCDAAGVARHAIRGIVGHVSDETTDLYSHDLTSARQIQSLDWVDLGK